MNINWLPYLTLLHFGAFIFYIYLGLLILYYNYRSPTNRAASYLLFAFALWSFVKIFSHNINTPQKIVLLFENIFSFTWILIPFLSFYLFAVFTKNESIFKNKVLFILVFLLDLILYINVLNGNMFDSLTLKNYGWFRQWKNNIWVYIYYTYLGFFAIYGLYFLFKNYFQTKNKIRKKFQEFF